VAVSKELDRRLRASRFAGYVELSAWLTSLGHPVGKTAIGKYAASYRHRLAGEALVRGRGLERAQLRTQCLQAAAMQGEATAETTIKRAERFVAWVVSGQ
jgi:hypothetical protein